MRLDFSPCLGVSTLTASISHAPTRRTPNCGLHDPCCVDTNGINPDAFGYSGTEIEVIVSNGGTLQRQWEGVMELGVKVRGGNLPGKTIVFAMTKKHGERNLAVFEVMYPQHVGMLQVIHQCVERVHDGPNGDGLINNFKKLDKPRIAVSADMLDTGIDVTEGAIDSADVTPSAHCDPCMATR